MKATSANIAVNARGSNALNHSDSVISDHRTYHMYSIKWLVTTAQEYC